VPLSPYTRLGPYEILSAIGAGGMGEVYKGRGTRLDRTVAIKVLPEHLSASVMTPKTATAAASRLDNQQFGWVARQIYDGKC
jgi:serine/threonine protein kinase